MKRARKLRLDDRAKLLLTSGLAAVLLITALLLPLAFRGGEAPVAPAAASEGKRRLFADYWLLDPAELGITVTKESNVSRETAQACEAVMQRLVEECIDDRQFYYEVPDGSEYTTLRDASGTQVRLCRMWLEAQGDWRNWLDACFDAESGEVYYLYLSRECLTNRSDYGRDQGGDVRTVAEGLASAYGWTLRWLEEGAESASALFTGADGGTACYQIDCRCYEMLVDVKLCCR